MPGAAAGRVAVGGGDGDDPVVGGALLAGGVLVVDFGDNVLVEPVPVGAGLAVHGPVDRVAQRAVGGGVEVDRGGAFGLVLHADDFAGLGGGAGDLVVIHRWCPVDPVGAVGEVRGRERHPRQGDGPTGFAGVLDGRQPQRRGAGPVLR